jgi:hypothetical protein
MTPGKFYVVRELSFTDRTHSLKVMSRPFDDKERAECWMDFCLVDEPAKGREYMVVQVVAHKEND